ncbi:nitrilase [Cryptosporangium sp. NPDC051539]|uniref:nitrilase n=1 Tax=Cryptosporangium sp. NPDC051539 TaxID=3363962 RepID=UPI003798EF0B
MTTRPLALAASAAAVSGALWLAGSGLHPIAVATWLAPLPPLLLAPRVSARTAGVVAAVAWLIGQAGIVGYYRGTLQFPVPAVVAVVLFGASLFAGVVLVARALVRSGRTATAVLAAPSVWVLGEYGLSLLLPHGAWWSLGYTQADDRFLVQLAALTGVWGLAFVLFAVPVGVAAVFVRRRLAAAVPLALVVALATAWSAWWLATGPQPAADSRQAARLSGQAARLSVGLVTRPQTGGSPELDTAEGTALLRDYRIHAETLADAGADVILMPEKIFVVTDATIATLADAFEPLTARGVAVVVGAELHRPVGAGVRRSNVALAFTEPGSGPAVYAKQHLIPGLEGDLTPGHRGVFVPGRTFALAVCKDLDFPGLVRGYRGRGATTILAPAYDFTQDGWLHSRMALVRGVESGVGIVRTARKGRLLVSDATGKRLAEATDASRGAALLADLPTTPRRTPYARAGNWFPYLCALLLLAAAVRMASLQDFVRARFT